jgi:hypothetical protein
MQDIGTATGYGLDGLVVSVRIPEGVRLFTSPRLSDRFGGGGAPSPLPNGCQGISILGQSGRGVKLTTHHHLVPTSKIRGSIHSVPNTPSWRSAKLAKHRGNFTFTLTYEQGVPFKMQTTLH